MHSGRAPSYKAMAIALLKNDASGKTLGFSPEVGEAYKAIKRMNDPQQRLLL